MTEHWFWLIPAGFFGALVVWGLVLLLGWLIANPDQIPVVLFLGGLASALLAATLETYR